jgi:hypothetical protein
MRYMVGLVSIMATVTSVAIVAIWWRSHHAQDLLFWSDNHGTAYGIATAPDQLVLFKNSDLRSDPKTLYRPRGFWRESYRYAPNRTRRLTVSDRYVYPTHRAFVWTSGGGPNITAWQPTFTSRSSFLGVAEQGGQFRGVAYAQVLFPFWLILAPVSAIPLLAALRKIRARWRAARFRCRYCGYDLRASPDRCPECGRPASTAATPPSPLPHAAPPPSLD